MMCAAQINTVRVLATIVGLCWLLTGACNSPSHPDAADPPLEMTAEELADRIRGGLVGQLLGNLNGLEHEMRYIHEPGQVETYTPALPEGARSDDDTDLEWVYVTAMQRSGELYLPADSIARLWTTHINRYIWSSNRYARQLIDLGIDPPLTGRLALNPWAEFNISGQFVCESFGLVAPGMPRSAARLGLHYTHVTIDAEPAQTTQLFTAMIAEAFRTSDLEEILDAGLASIDPESRIGQIVRDVRSWHQMNPGDWEATRRLTKEKYSLYDGEMRDRNGYELNTASTIAALLYGNGDFVETLKTAFNFGWDADNNAATAGTIIGVIRGYDWMVEQGWDIRDLYRNNTRDGMPEDETITGFGDRLLAVAEEVIRAEGGEVIERRGEKTFRIRTQQPGNVEALPDLVAQQAQLRNDLAPTIEADLAGDFQARARAAYLAICLDLATALKERHPTLWPEAIDALRGYPKVLSVMFSSPPPLGPSLRDRAAAFGLSQPEEQENWWD